MQTQNSPQSRRDKVRGHIKAVAQRLFADGGLAGVTTRDITSAAGYKNTTLINYYFGSKAGLIAEIIADVVTALERDRHARLDALEAAGGPCKMREVLEILATPVASCGVEADEDFDYTARFFNSIVVNHRDILLEVMGSATDAGTRRCLAHLRRMMPTLPAPLVRQRLNFMLLFLTAGLSSREAASEHPQTWRYLWGEASTWSCMLDTAEAMLTHMPSSATLADR